MKDISPVVLAVIRGRVRYRPMAERSLYQSGQNSKTKAAEILTAAFLLYRLRNFFHNVMTFSKLTKGITMAA